MFVLLAMLSACTGDTCGAAGGASARLLACSYPTISTKVPLSTSDWQPGDDAMAAEVRGRLAATDDGCVYLRGPGGPVDVVWPADWTARRQADGSVDLIDHNGDVVAHTGQRISTGGGFKDYRTSDLACSARENDVKVAETAVVQEDEVVVL